MPPSLRRHHPHDKVFRRVFKQVEHALGALRALVGEDLEARLDWQTLRIEPGSYVEEALRDLMSDLLFSVRLRGGNQRTLLYLLWDHQRRPDRMMPLRFHNYGGRALHDYTQSAGAIPGYVPALIPLLVYQGPGEWPGPHLLSELSLLPGEPMPPIHMDLRMIVHALGDGSLPPERLTLLARTTLRLLRCAAMGELVVANAPRIAGWLDEVHETYGYDDYRSLLEYVWSAGSEQAMIESIIEHSHHDVKESALSAADWLRAQGWKEGRVEGREEGRVEGREEGRVEGREEGLRSLLLRQLELRFGRLPPHVEAKVLAAGASQVEAWALRLLVVSALDDVLGP